MKKDLLSPPWKKELDKKEMKDWRDRIHTEPDCSVLTIDRNYIFTKEKLVHFIEEVEQQAREEGLKEIKELTKHFSDDVQTLLVRNIGDYTYN